MPSSMPQIVWFKRDLRIVDHAPFACAAERGPVLPLYIVEPALWRQPDMSLRHWQFLEGCLRDLDESLREIGGQLILRVGETIPVLQALHDQIGAFALHAHQETGTDWTFQRDKAVIRWCRAHDIAFLEQPQFGVVRGLKKRDGWSAKWDRFMKKRVVPVPAEIDFLAGWHSDPIPRAAELGLCDDGMQDPQAPGRAPALAMLRSFLLERGETYQRDMSSPIKGVDGCSRLSPYLAYGCVSMREVAQAGWNRQAAIAALPPGARGRWPGAAKAFLARLHWHCHFIQKLESEPTLEFENLASAYNGLREPDFRQDYFEAWAAGETGYPFVDACMRSLRATGWINFRMRAMLMSFAAYDLWLHWREPSLHLARMFTDYEPGIHYSQCQMQSGTTGINTLRIYSPVKQSRDQDPEGIFIRRWVPELRDVPDDWIHEPWRMDTGLQQASGCIIGAQYPAPIIDHKAAVAAAKDKMYAVRRRKETRAEAEAIVAKHGSRRRRWFARKDPDPRQTSLDLGGDT